MRVTSHTQKMLQTVCGMREHSVLGASSPGAPKRSGLLQTSRDGNDRNPRLAGRHEQRDTQVASLAKGCDWLTDRTELYPLTHFFLRVHQSLVYLSIYSMQRDCENPGLARPRCGHAPVPTPTLVRGPRPPRTARPQQSTHRANRPLHGTPFHLLCFTI